MPPQHKLRHEKLPAAAKKQNMALLGGTNYQAALFILITACYVGISVFRLQRKNKNAEPGSLPGRIVIPDSLPCCTHDRYERMRFHPCRSCQCTIPVIVSRGFFLPDIQCDVLLKSAYMFSLIDKCIKIVYS